jgi:MSHA biogenesis protein MshQ
MVHQFWTLFLGLLWSCCSIAAVSLTGSTTETTGTGTATSLSLSPVSGAARADLLLVQVTLNSHTATVTPPAGWTELSAIAQATTGIQQRVYWRVRSNSETTPYVWTFSASVRAAAILADFAGVDAGVAINASAGQIGSGTSIVAPELAVAYSSSTFVGFFGTTGVSSAITPQATMAFVNSTSAASGGVGVRSAMAYEALTSDGLSGVRTAAAALGTYAVQTIALTPSPTPVVCFSDSFNRASLGSNWATSNSKGGFNPAINTNRLQLTQNVTNQATLAVLQRFFPAAGNNVVVTFKQYAYPNGGGTSGADGIVTIFSDATVPPVAGGSGGSLGYAQYNSPASTPGFAGGWLGVGIDEYGNFSNASENRYLGPGARINSIAVRGPSNSFYSSGVGSSYAQGYPYIAGSASLTPILGSTTSIASGGGPADIYRITIDSRVPGEQWVQVERSTNGGVSYTAHVPFFNMMTNLRALSGWAAVTLPQIPANFWLSFTGGTGGARNIHEIDDLEVCATKMVASTAAIDHFRFENPSSMDTCSPKAIKVTACTDAAPSCTPFAGDVQVTLKPSGWVGGNTVKLVNGKGTLQLSQSTAGTVVLDIDKTKTVWPALKNSATYATECVVPGTNTSTTCNLTVSASSAGFGFTFPTTAPAACDDSGDVLIKACSAGYANTNKNLQFWFAYTDPSTTADATRVVQLSKDAWTTSTNLATTAPTSASVPATVGVSFDSSATAKVRVKYADVGKLTLNVRDSAATSTTGSGTFIVRPASFAVTAVTDNSATPVANPAATDATGTKFVAAGMPFKVTVEARNNCASPAATKNFGKESSPEGIVFDQALASGLGLSNNPTMTTTTDFSFTNGAGTATVSWPEVGILKLTPRLKSGGYLGTSDVVGIQSGNIGRFFAHSIATVVDTQGCGTFTYDGQPIAKVTLTAKANGGNTLINYRGSSTAAFSFAKPVTLTDTTAKGAFASSVSALAFSGGIAVLDGFDANHAKATFQFTTKPTAPSVISIAAADTDSSGVAGTAGSAQIRSGRVRLGNAYGSELLPLSIPLELQYWSGGWLRNTADNCSGLSVSQFAWTFPAGTATRPNNLAACESAISLTGSPPNQVATLSRPGTGNAGWADLSLNLGATAVGSQCSSVGGSGGPATTAAMPWLQFDWTGVGAANPSARVTFGVFRSPLIYRRENY